MANCKYCGKKTRKNRQVCIGCNCVKAFARKGDKASNFEFKKAEKHLGENPDLLIINWPSFSKKH